MQEKSISSDSSFYICFSNDLNRIKSLIDFTESYAFYYGKRILSELPEELVKNEDFLSNCHIVDLDYFELIKPFFGRQSNHSNDGEYEAIGIGNYLNDLGTLKYLIVDDLRARKFIESHFPDLKTKMVGTMGFLRDGCCQDKTIDPFTALTILDDVKAKIQANTKNRPCGMDLNKYQEIITPIIENIRKVAGLSI